MIKDSLIKQELAAIGYDRCGKQRMPKGWERYSKYVYRGSWSTAEVEHFLYLGQDSRQYFTADFGLRNPVAEAFGLEAISKYGHANFQLVQEKLDLTTGCSMAFSLGCLNEISRSPWPRIHLSEISSADLATFIGDFARENLLPFVKTITDLQTYLAFVVADRAPNPWLATANHMVRAAQVVAAAAQLGRNDAEITELLRPHEWQIARTIPHIAANKSMGVDEFLDSLISDWHRKYLDG